MPVPQPPSLIWSLAVDPPVVQDATYRFTNVDRAYLDSQIQGVQTHLVQSLIGGYVCSWYILDSGSANVTAGSVVCISTSVAPTVTLATAGALGAAGRALGIVLTVAPPGGWVRVALFGVLAPSLTGLPTTGNSVYAKVNAATGTVTTASTLSGGDYPLGTVSTSGNLNLAPQFTPIAGASVPTSIFVNSNTTLTNANSGQAIKIDSSGGALTVKLPNITTDDAEFLYIDCTAAGSWGTHNVTVTTPGATNLIRDPNLLSGGTSTSVTLKNPGQSVKWKADLARLIYQLV